MKREIYTALRIAAGEFGAFIGLFFGDVDGLIIALVIFAIVDYITGVLAAAFEHKLNSEVGFRGITKKVLLFIIVGIANVLDIYVIGSRAVTRTAVCLFYIANEGLSILENSARIGLPIPNKIRLLLEQLREEDQS